MATVDVKDATNNTVAIEKPLAPGRAAAAASKPVVLASEDFAVIGALTETAPASDTASSGLNGRLQRLAQRLTTLIAFFRLGQGTMAQSLAVTLASDQSAVAVAPVAVAPASTSVTIASGASLSGAADFGDRRLGAIIMPASWTAAAMTIQVSVDGTNYYNLYDQDGVEFSMSADASRTIVIDPSYFGLIRYVKVRSGTAGVPVNQGADRILVLVAG